MTLWYMCRHFSKVSMYLIVSLPFPFVGRAAEVYSFHRNLKYNTILLPIEVMLHISSLDLFILCIYYYESSNLHFSYHSVLLNLL